MGRHSWTFLRDGKHSLGLLPQHSSQDRDIARGQGQAHAGRTRTANITCNKRGLHWQLNQALEHLTPQNCAISMLWSALLQPGPSNLNYSTILQLHIFLLLCALALMSFCLVPIFKHFYIIEKRGETGTKQFLKVLAQIQVCIFAFLTIHTQLCYHPWQNTDTDIQEQIFFFLSFESSFWPAGS